MQTYRIKGARFLRKYSESGVSPVYAASIQAQTLAANLCNVPWVRVAESKSELAYHTDEKIGEKSGFDANLDIRNGIDAALFCTDHVGGMHKAHANGAVYRFEFPDSAIGTTLSSLKVCVTSDPYNAAGARLHIWTDSVGSIPMPCRAVRGNDANDEPLTDGTTISEFCKRITSGSGSSASWFPNAQVAEFSPTTPLTLGKFLYLSVLLESYSTVRGNFLEGSSCIDNDVEITLSEACADLDADGLNDLSIGETPEHSVAILRDGVTVDLSGSVSGVVAVTMTSSGITPILDEGRHVDDLTRIVDESNPSNIEATIRNVYRRFFTGDVELADFASVNPRRRPCGVGFCVSQSHDVKFVNAAGDISSARAITLTASSLLIPFSKPESMVVSKVVFDWSKWLVGRDPSAACSFAFWFRPESVTGMAESTVKDPAIYNASKDEVDGWALLGSARVSAGRATFDVPALDGDVGTILVTAYVGQDSISDSSSDFDVGSAPIRYNGVTADEGLPVSRLYYPAFDPTHKYTTGESMRYVSAEDVGFDVMQPNASVNNVFVGNGVVVGVSGRKFVYSFDGVRYYSSNETIVETSLENIYYFDGRFIALGGWYVYTSTDGRTWTRTANEKTVDENVVSLLTLAYGDGKWVAGTGDRIVFSTDFETWQPTNVEGSVSNVAFCGSFWIANVDGAIMRSLDGLEWVSVPDAPVEFLSVAYSPEGVAFVSDELNPKLYTSSDGGAHWTATELDDDAFVDVVYANGVWLALSNSAVYKCTTEQPSSFLKDIDGGGSFIAFNGCYVIAGDNSGVKCTNVGGQWHEKAIRGFGVLKPVSFGSAWLANGKTFDDNRSRKAYLASEESTGSFSAQHFAEVASPVRDRLTGNDGFCFPDVTLIG